MFCMLLLSAETSREAGAGLMGFGTTLALAIGTGMDNFAVGASYGCRGRRVPHVCDVFF